METKKINKQTLIDLINDRDPHVTPNLLRPITAYAGKNHTVRTTLLTMACHGWPLTAKDVTDNNLTNHEVNAYGIALFMVEDYVCKNSQSEYSSRLTDASWQHNRAYKMPYRNLSPRKTFSRIDADRSKAHHGIINSTLNLRAYMGRYTEAKLVSGEWEDMPSKFFDVLHTHGVFVPAVHGLHISTQDRSFLAWFPDIRHIKRGVPQKIRPGRYLKRLAPNLPDQVINHLASMIGDYKLHFYSHSGGMYQAYKELKDSDIVESCMAYPSSEWEIYNRQGERYHPLDAYHNSDVELAVLRTAAGEALARALYNKNNKQYPIIYGQWERMEPMLEAMGFTHRSLCGARINKLEAFDRYGNMKGYVMPYIDGHREHKRTVHNAAYVYEHDDSFEITTSGIQANRHNEGYISAQYECPHCGYNLDEDEWENRTWLEREEEYACEHCDVVEVYSGRAAQFVASESYANHNCIYIDGSWYEDSEVVALHGYVWSDYADEWLDGDDAYYCEEEQDYIPDYHVYGVDDFGIEPKTIATRYDYIYVNETGETYSRDTYADKHNEWVEENTETADETE